MKLKGDFVIVGLDVRHGVKDPSKVYNRVLLRDVQGTDTLEVGVNDEMYNQAIKLGEFVKVSCVVNYNASYKSFSLDAIQLLASQSGGGKQ